MKPALTKTQGASAAAQRGSMLKTNLKRSAAPVLPRRNLGGREAAPSTICNSTFGVSDAPSVVTLVGQVASAGAWALAAWMGYQVAIQQDVTRQSGEKECEVCHGTGYVECFCTRWSDSAGDKSGCGTCRGSRRMSCTGCGGGGTGVPIEARVYIKSEKKYY